MSDTADARPISRRAKRGYRKVTLTLRVSDYALLEQIADDEQREPGQQAAFMLRTLLDHARKQEGIPMDSERLDEEDDAVR